MPSSNKLTPNLPELTNLKAVFDNALLNSTQEVFTAKERSNSWNELVNSIVSTSIDPAKSIKSIKDSVNAIVAYHTEPKAFVNPTGKKKTPVKKQPTNKFGQEEWSLLMQKAFNKWSPVTTVDSGPEYTIVKDKVASALKSKVGATTARSYMQALQNMELHIADKKSFMMEILTGIDPNLVVWKVGDKVKPGEMHGMPPPDIELTPAAKAHHIDDATAEAHIAKLQVEIQKYENAIAEIERRKRKAYKARQNLENRISESTLKYLSYIEKNCGEFLKSVYKTQKLLYRGQSDSKQPIFIGYPRNDRAPKDSSKEAQLMLDGFLKEKGFTALRGNSIFTSSDKDQAEEYGRPYAIFPKDGFQFTWSTKKDDIVISSVDALLSNTGSNSAEAIMPNINGWMTLFNELVNNDLIQSYSSRFGLDYFPSDPQVEKVAKKLRTIPNWGEFENAVKKFSTKKATLSEILHSAKAAITNFLKIQPHFATVTPPKKESSNWPSANQLKELKRTLKNINAQIKLIKDPLQNKKDTAQLVIDKYGFIKDNLEAALKSGHEVAIFGEYVAVNYSTYKDDINTYFGISKSSSIADDEEDYIS